jgi:uncharacterized protein (DUF433 family)
LRPGVPGLKALFPKLFPERSSYVRMRSRAAGKFNKYTTIGCIFIKWVIQMRGFSLREAAAIAEIPESTIRTAIEKRSIAPQTSRVGKSIRYEFDLNELLFIKLLSEFPFSLPKEDKESLRKLLGKSSGSAGRWQMRGPDLLIKKGGLSVSVHYRPLRKLLVQNVNLYRKGVNRIVSRPETLGGGPVFKGTRISLEHISGLFRKGVGETEIREDYPSLSELDLGFASIHARLSPPPGRPRKRLELGRGKAA